MKISGFTIVRNAQVLDYPFREAVLSVLPLCDEFIINCGDSDDVTAEICERLAKDHPRIRVIYNTWAKDAQSGGFQLKHQSDLALAQCKGDWCLYIQADEALHQDDYAAIKEAMHRADARPEVDGLVSNYLHFYGNYDWAIRGRNWYRREVRAFKNHRGIAAYRDAQGFRKNGEKLKVIASGARVFHYGYVRTSQSLGAKSEQMAQWWGKKPVTDAKSLELKRHVGLTRFQSTHPGVMADRLRDKNPEFDPRRCRRTWDRNEVKNALTLVWESVFPIRLGEFTNYEFI